MDWREMTKGEAEVVVAGILLVWKDISKEEAYTTLARLLKPIGELTNICMFDGIFKIDIDLKDKKAILTGDPISIAKAIDKIFCDYFLFGSK